MNPHNFLFLKIFFVALLSGFLASCASLPPVPEFATTFELRGKVGITDATESYSATLLWRQGQDRFVIDIWGPLGQGRLRLSGDRRTLSLQDGQGAVVRSGTPQEVMTAELGWYLPLEVLPSWVLGEPAPESPVAGATVDDAGRLIGFTQLDWQVSYDRFRTHVVGGLEKALPRRITAHRGDYRVRVVVNDLTL